MNFAEGSSLAEVAPKPERCSGGKDVGFIIACIGCAIPVLLSHYPPMVDAPQHAAQIAAIKHILSGDSWRFSNYFQLEVFTPYLLGYSVAVLLSYIVGTAWAMKLVVGLAAFSFPMAGRHLLRVSGGDLRLKWLLLPLPFGLAYQWGFVNFLFAAPLGMLFLASMYQEWPESGWRRFIQVMLWLHLLFVAHVLTAFFFSCCAICMLALERASWRERLVRALPVFSVLPIALLWVMLNIGNEPVAERQFAWMLGMHRLTGLLPALVSSSQGVVWQVVGVFFLALPFLIGARLKRNAAAWAPFLVYLSWMMLVPHLLGGTSFIYERFGLFGLPLYFLAFELSDGVTSRSQRLLVLASLAISLAMLGVHAVKAVTFNAEVAGYRAVIQHANPGGRMLMLAFEPRSRVSYAPLMLHFSGWYQAERDGLSEFSFSSFWGVPAHFRSDATGVIRQGFEWRPHEFDWDTHHGGQYDYFLVRHPQSAEGWMAERSAGRVVLIARSEDWQLYGRAVPAISSGGSHTN